MDAVKQNSTGLTNQGTMLIKRQVIDRIGGLDDRYGLGNFEDDDFTLRVFETGT